MRIPFFQHDLGATEVAAVAEVLAGPILTTGETVASFEREFGELFGGAHTVGVTSCTAAIQLALTALGVGPGDEVVTTPLTFVATASAIVHAGARPVFVDVEPHTGNLDTARIEAALGPRTRAIVPVHLYGQMCDMREIRRIADRHGLVVVEDAAHAVESRRDGVRPGALSDAACFSFYATKSLTSGEGGAVVTRSAELADRLRLLRLHGMTSSAVERARSGFRPWDVPIFGWKYNMDNIQAALLRPQLRRLAANRECRRILAERYRRRLAEVDGVRLLDVLPGVEHAWHLFTVLVERDRDAVVSKLWEAGVGTTVNYGPVHLLTWFRQHFGFGPGRFPVSEDIGARTLSLPLFPGLAPDLVDVVVERLVQALPGPASVTSR